MNGEATQNPTGHLSKRDPARIATPKRQKPWLKCEKTTLCANL